MVQHIRHCESLFSQTYILITITAVGQETTDRVKVTIYTTETFLHQNDKLLHTGEA